MGTSFKSRLGCQQSGCEYGLIGGETADMPGFYAEGEYDLVGCALGIVKKDSVIDGKNLVAGDVLIGLPSSGLHSNGFSLVRRVVAQSGFSLKDQLPGGSISLGEALMASTVIYVKQAYILFGDEEYLYIFQEAYGSAMQYLHKDPCFVIGM